MPTRERARVRTPADLWNSPARNATGVTLNNSVGSATTVTYTEAGVNGTYGSGNPNGVLGTYAYDTTTGNGPIYFTFGGLAPGVVYNLYAIMDSNMANRAVTCTTGGSTQTITTPANYASVSITSTSVYCEFAGLVANAGGQINVTVASNPGGVNETDVNGFQLIPFNMPTGSVNLPNSSIVTTGTSTLDFGGYGPANALGGLGLGGNVTVQNVVSGGSVQFGGDVVATANATVSLAAGAGSVPMPVLSGNSAGVQNINAASGATLTLPALSITTGTVNVGNTSGYRGNVVLGGATALTASSPTVNVSAGTLNVGGTLSGSAGAAVQVRAGATLAGGPGGSIGIPVTVQTGATFAPDASAASTALFTNSLTISPSAAFQWSYTSGTAAGTLALGGADLNLPGSGNPIFRPQFVIAPVLPVYVMTWNTSPANQSAWSFDGSLVTAGNLAVWNDANGSWDTGANWVYPSYTSATLVYQPGGLQLTGLGVTNVAGTAAPAAGTNVLIAPPSISSVAVTGPAEPAVLGALIIEGSGSATASLALQSGGPVSPTSVAVARAAARLRPRPPH